MDETRFVLVGKLKSGEVVYAEKSTKHVGVEIAIEQGYKYLFDPTEEEMKEIRDNEEIQKKLKSL